MKFKHKTFIAIDRLKFKQIVNGLLLSILLLLCLISRSTRAIVFIAALIFVAAIVGGTIGTLAGMGVFLLFLICAMFGRQLRRLGERLLETWEQKESDLEYLEDRHQYSRFSRLRSVRSQLRMLATQSRSVRLQTIAELQAAIRARSPNLSIQDLQDLNFLGREHHQIIDEESWSPTRRSRVDRIATIRNSRRNNGQNLPSGLVEVEDESEFMVTYSDLQSYGALDDDPDGIGDLTCEYNAHSLFLRCAVNPGAETCEGCRDYRSRDTTVGEF